MTVGEFSSWEEPTKSWLSSYKKSAHSSLLFDSIEYSLWSGGKRLRPKLLLAVAGSVGLKPENLWPAAAAVEMTHCFSLIHDDLPAMDNDSMRRGKPTNHVVYGEAIALLAGDSLLTLAQEVLLELESSFSPMAVMAAQRCLLRQSGPLGLAGGQALEFDLESKKPSKDEMDRIHAMKTGALFCACFEIPACLVGLPADSLSYNALSQLGLQFGKIFQFLDDRDDQAQDHANPSNLNHVAFSEIEKTRAELLSNWNRIWSVAKNHYPKLPAFLEPIVRPFVDQIESSSLQSPSLEVRSLSQSHGTPDRQSV